MRLKELREEARLSQRELGMLVADELGEGEKNEKSYQSRVSAWEAGRNEISLTVGMAIVRVLNVELKRVRSKTRAELTDLAPES